MMELKDYQNLRECPFCGNTATLMPFDVFGAKWFYVKCDKCNAEINDPAPDKEKAIRAWNRRANDG